MFGLVKRFISTYRNFDMCYVAVDLHGTCLKPTFDNKTKVMPVSHSVVRIATEYYPLAVKTLKMMCDRHDTKLIMWTSSYTDDILQYNYHFYEDHGIHFVDINENHECVNSKYACFDKKMYFDVGLDDRFGFNPYIDWPILYIYFKLKKIFNR